MALEKLAGCARTWSLFWMLGALAGCNAADKSASTHSVERTANVSQATTSQNGFVQNGLSTNGFISNGFISNGFISNGFISNGFISNGFISNGFISNGFISNGFISNGFISNGLVPNGFISNGFISNGFISNGLWSGGQWVNGYLSNALISSRFLSNGAAADLLKSSAYARQFLQYVYSCAMPPGSQTTLDPWNGTLACGDGGTCDVGYACSSAGTCVIPLPPPNLGLLGLGINSDGSHWWDTPGSDDAGAGDAGAGDAGAGDAGVCGAPTSKSGTCDESCQRWVSACMLARTNAYGVHVELSLRAPSPATIPAGHECQFAQIQAALATSCDEVGTYTMREGAYYGNIFATTPVTCDANGCAPAGPPASDGPATGPVEETPSYFACAGPDSNVPEVTKRFCSSQGDQVVISVPGICVSSAASVATATGGDGGCEAGSTSAADAGATTTGPVICDGMDSTGSVDGCYTAGGRTGARYDEVLTVYLTQPIAVCGNAVCEPPSENSTSCASDCHPGTWAKDLGHDFESFQVPAHATPFYEMIPSFTDYAMAAVAPDPTDAIVVVGETSSAVNLGGVTLPAGPPNGVLVKYNPDGSYGWPGRGVRFGSPVISNVTGVTVAASGNITVVGVSGNAGASNPILWISTFDAAGSPLLTRTWAPGSSSLSLASGRALAVDSQGNVLVAGKFTGTATFPTVPTPTSLTTTDIPNGYGAIFLTKISPQGSMMWAQRLTGNQFVGSLVVDSAGNIVLTAWQSSTLPGPTLVKLCADGSTGQCADGSMAWTKTFGGLGAFTVAAVDAVGNVYASGNFGTGVNFDGGQIAITGFPPFIVKYDSNGKFQWANHGNVVCPPSPLSCGYGQVWGANIGFDAAGNVVLASWGDPSLGGGIDFGFGTFPTYHSNNIFLAAYQPNPPGSLQWGKQIPGVLGVDVRGIALDSHGRVVMSGTYGGSMQVDNLLLVTTIPEQPSEFDPFLASFGGPSPLITTPPTIGAASDPSGAPIVTVPQDIVVQATSSAGALVFFMPPTAIDNGDSTHNVPPPGTSVFCSPPPNTVFPIGATPVTCTASDPLGNHSSASFNVTVRDTLGPAFTSATVADITVQATSASGVAVQFAPVATDAVDGPITPICKPLSGSTFPFGISPVVCTATDKANNQTVAAFTVTVKPPPLTPPTVTCIGSQASPAIVPVPQGVCGITMSNTSGSAGTCAGGGGGGLASCTFGGQASETLGPGTYALAVLGTADDGTTAGCTSYLTVVDNQSPAIQCISQTLECTGSSSATSTPTATCSDNCSCTASCTRATFPLGTTPGSCSATDLSGNTARCQPNITVVDTTAPVVTPRPGPSQLQCHVDMWTDPGATALDVCTGDLSASVKATGIVDPMHVGSYSVSYSAMDPSGNVGSATRTVAVIDTLAPVITLNASPPVLQCGVDSYAEAGATAVDACVGNLTSKISETGSVNANAAGTYALTYSVADPSGNRVNAVRSVSVVDTLLPTARATGGPNPPGNRYININVTSYSVVPRGGGTAITGSADCWTSPGLSVALNAVDACSLKQLTYALSGAQTGGATVSGGSASFTLTKAGSTTVTYFATDNAGNQEAAQTLPVFIGHSFAGFGFSCAPSPSLKNLPAHGTVTAKGTVTFTDPRTGKTTTQPFSFTHSY